jgi:drug/metabolite transporter (DMT)-like permease
MIDVLLLLMALIWGTNYSIVKSAFTELDPHAFNAARMVIASMAFLGIIGLLRVPAAGAVPRGLGIASIFQTATRLTIRDGLELVGLGLVGHLLYQYFFIGGLALTTVANSSLMLATTPVVIAIIGAAFGHERVGRRHWAGAALSLLGVYIVVGRGVDLGARGVTGDLMMVAAVLCWAVYTLGSRRLISRHSPVAVTGLSMSLGTLMYVPVMWSHVSAVAWDELRWQTWISILYSSIFALGVAYTIWYAAVRQIGSARTSVYSNVIPIVAMATAVIFLGEPLRLINILGATAVLLGVALTRTAPAEPCEP